ncbi:MAG: hypothetical protein C0469_03100 [Cyanobacteria bacterium DS2.3.42]|nr:hypothetical protein [Cyanobacteria bacterium DS2.3.42]
MGFPDNGTFNDRTESQVGENTSPLASDLMVDPASNEIYKLAQSSQNGDISFLPPDGMLLSDLEDVQISSYSSGGPDDTTIDPADQVSYPERDQVSYADQAQVSYPEQDQVSYPEQPLVSVNETANDVEVSPRAQVSTDTTNQVADVTSQASDASLYQFADASIRTAHQYPRSEQNNCTIGALEHGYDENNEHISITGPKGEYFYKGSDGKWVEHMPPSGERTVENLTFDKDGNMEFDVVGDGTVAHHVRNADGSYSIKSPEYGGTLKYDKDGNLVEAPAGDGKVRTFHYTNGQLDQIDGRLGHWQRVEKDGKVSWVNEKTKAVWEGEMHVNVKTNDLEFRGRNGVAWNFTTRGQDVYARAR